VFERRSSRLAHLVDAAVDVLLDVQPFDHGLDDPVAVGEQREVVLEIAGRDPARVLLGHERRRLGLPELVEGAAASALRSTAPDGTMSSRTTGMPHWRRGRRCRRP